MPNILVSWLFQNLIVMKVINIQFIGATILLWIKFQKHCVENPDKVLSQDFLSVIPDNLSVILDKCHENGFLRYFSSIII